MEKEKDYYISLLEKLENSKIKNQLTIAEYGKFVQWIKNKFKHKKPTVDAVDEVARKREAECSKKCSKDKKCLNSCLLYSYQRIIGSLKVAKTKCNKSQKCFDKLDAQIKKFALKIDALTGKK